MFAAPTKGNACLLALPSLPVSAGYWSVESTGLIYDCPQVRTACICVLPAAPCLCAAAKGVPAAWPQLLRSIRAVLCDALVMLRLLPPCCACCLPLLPAQATYLRVANYSLFALFGLAAINEAAIFVLGLRGTMLLGARPFVSKLSCLSPGRLPPHHCRAGCSPLPAHPPLHLLALTSSPAHTPACPPAHPSAGGPFQTRKRRLVPPLLYVEIALWLLLLAFTSGWGARKGTSVGTGWGAAFHAGCHWRMSAGCFCCRRICRRTCCC